MKIGILTFHRAHNYGAALQAYALQEALKQRGHDVEFIDYRNPNIINCYNWFIFHRIFPEKFWWKVKFWRKKVFKRIIFQTILLFPRKKRYDKFNHFIKHYLKESDQFYNLSVYDLIIIGSDQVWSTELTNGFDDMYWGKWKNSSKPKLVSYGASMDGNIIGGNQKTISENLNNFDLISVREQSLAYYLKKITQNDIYTVADPTLLLETKYWDRLIDTPIIKGRYVLLYQVRNSDHVVKIANDIAKNLNAKVIYLSAWMERENSRKIRTSGPLQFLNLFKHATFVVGTSFHGTIFSLIFHKPFCAILLNDGKENRVTDLLTQLNLQNRGISELSQQIFDPINWNTVDQQIETIRKNSFDFLSIFC